MPEFEVNRIAWTRRLALVELQIAHAWSFSKIPALVLAPVVQTPQLTLSPSSQREPPPKIDTPGLELATSPSAR
jgi:hypothetical protein